MDKIVPKEGKEEEIPTPEKMKLKHLTETFTTFKPQDLIKVNLGCIAITKADKIKELTPKQQMSLWKTSIFFQVSTLMMAI